jgi:hypothetical protein
MLRKSLYSHHHAEGKAFMLAMIECVPLCKRFHKTDLLTAYGTKLEHDVFCLLGMISDSKPYMHGTSKATRPN